MDQHDLDQTPSEKGEILILMSFVLACLRCILEGSNFRGAKNLEGSKTNLEVSNKSSVSLNGML